MCCRVGLPTATNRSLLTWRLPTSPTSTGPTDCLNLLGVAGARIPVLYMYTGNIAFPNATCAKRQRLIRSKISQPKAINLIRRYMSRVSLPKLVKKASFIRKQRSDEIKSKSESLNNDLESVA
ncbi:hypothetical protein QE152_g25167 [Popillia japonica]|uniref:Uncharacterized protein n=1 Tax=Popillia japonica TaxID=7064 RepID=A0AAW1K1Q8_POPJA